MGVSVQEEWLEAGRPQRPREERLGMPGQDRECAGSRESQTAVGWEQMVVSLVSKRGSRCYL